MLLCESCDRRNRAPFSLILSHLFEPWRRYQKKCCWWWRKSDRENRMGLFIWWLSVLPGVQREKTGLLSATCMQIFAVSAYQYRLKGSTRTMPGCSLTKSIFFSVQVRRSAQMVKPKSSFSSSFILERAPHSIFLMRAVHSKTETLPKNCCSNFCPNSRKKPTKNLRRKTGDWIICSVGLARIKHINIILPQLLKNSSCVEFRDKEWSMEYSSV